MVQPSLVAEAFFTRAIFIASGDCQAAIPSIVITWLGVQLPITKVITLPVIGEVLGTSRVTTSKQSLTSTEL